MKCFRHKEKPLTSSKGCKAHEQNTVGTLCDPMQMPDHLSSMDWSYTHFSKIQKKSAALFQSWTCYFYLIVSKHAFNIMIIHQNWNHFDLFLKYTPPNTLPDSYLYSITKQYNLMITHHNWKHIDQNTKL